MILQLDLLPAQEKQNIKLAKTYSFIKKQAWLLLSVLLLLNATVFYVKKNLARNLQEANRLLEENKKKNQSLISKVDGFNQNTVNFGTIQSSFSVQSNLFLKLASLTPSGITLTAVNLNSRNQLTLEGVYQKRDDLLILKDNLEADFMTDLNFPISNLLTQGMGRFSLSGTVADF
ncbi:MAG: hypothetical protein ABH896_02585 [Candidatus Jacksonbacteria bacterium]